MASNTLKVESGVQLLARLTRKTEIKNFYPLLFNQGPQIGHTIEIYSEYSTNDLIEEIISESLLPIEIGGKEARVLIFHTDGHISFDSLLNVTKRKLHKRLSAEKKILDGPNDVEKLLHIVLKNLLIIEVHDVNQFYITIQNLENILCKHSNISLIIFDTLTAFYWSEQEYKISKMDLYLKKLLLIIQRVTKDYKVIIIYTRPEYFSSTKGVIENLEQCCEHVTEEQVNYRLQMLYNVNGNNYVNIQDHEKIIKREFQIQNGEFTWL